MTRVSDVKGRSLAVGFLAGMAMVIRAHQAPGSCGFRTLLFLVPFFLSSDGPLSLGRLRNFYIL